MAREFWAADCETDPFKHGRFPEPFIFGAYNGDEYLEFSTAASFVEYFYERKVVIYAHNGGKFDWHFILDELEPGTKISVINGRLAKFKIGQAEFRDSFSLLPFPLAAWDKDKVDYSLFEKSEREKPKNKDIIKRYLRKDCVSLFDILSRFFADYGRKFTLAGASMAAWRKISGETEDNSSKHFYDELKKYYYGGRVECFRSGVGKGNFHVYDINSAYPFAMCSDHPWGTLYYTDNRLPKSAGEIQRSFISCTANSTGVWPFRTSAGLDFPKDHHRRTFHITGWEYLAARETGVLDATTKIERVVTFADKINFKTYVDHFFTLKSDAKRRRDLDDGDMKAKADYIFAKLFMNSLYGKFASDPSKYSEYLTCLPSEIGALSTPELGGWKIVCELHNVAIVSRPLPEPMHRFYNVAVGASITGFVRAHLWRAISQCKDVLYCDTDSIAARRATLSINGNLGGWADEGRFKSWGIAGKKLYSFEYRKPFIKDGKKITHKIASKGAKLTAQQIEAIAADPKLELQYEPEAPTFGLRGKRFTDRKIRKTA